MNELQLPCVNTGGAANEKHCHSLCSKSAIKIIPNINAASANKPFEGGIIFRRMVIF